MKKLLTSFFLLTLIMSTTGCREGIDKVLIGTWTVEKVEGVFNSNGNASPALTDENPTGTVTFRRDGTGEQNYSFTLNGTVYPQTGNFSWSATQDAIFIERVSEPDMEWNRIIDQNNKQVASYNLLINATQSWDYTLTLEK